VPPLEIVPLQHPPKASVAVPGSKSVTNRVLLISALASGESEIIGPLIADDTEAMIDAAAALGAKIEVGSNAISVAGVGGAIPSTGSVFARRSGTTARFVAPVLALSPGPWVLDGDDQLAARPMEDLYRSLEAIGASVDRPVGGRSLPVEIRGPIGGSAVSISGATTSQFLSGLLLAGPVAPGGLSISVDGALKSKPYVDLTIGVMRHFGAQVEEARSSYEVAAGGYAGRSITVEPDASTASYFYAAAAITGGRVRVEGLSRSSVQGDIAFVDYLEQMGAIVRDDGRSIAVEGSGPLTGIILDASDTTDIVPTLAVVAALATTRTHIMGIGFARAKESDRVGGLVTELRRCGVRATEEPDGIVIEPSTPHGARVCTYSDHRMAMAFAVLGLVVPGIELDEPECVAKTFPDFFEVLDQLRG
jgi:3-phosphoshikimate 1-carboxyvinyltransferase